MSGIAPAERTSGFGNDLVIALLSDRHASFPSVEIASLYPPLPGVLMIASRVAAIFGKPSYDGAIERTVATPTSQCWPRQPLAT